MMLRIKNYLAQRWTKLLTLALGNRIAYYNLAFVYLVAGSIEKTALYWVVSLCYLVLAVKV